ncbi:MAG: nickel pincer cofactor biosynthesis protein LarB, partial [Deltaproteobacteria bacterium]|nr:nickel pincer cofactor biosynthesis protein LarB [Deltaproteobacteria bacterium]
MALPEELSTLLDRLASGDMTRQDAETKLAKHLRQIDDLGFARLDTDRARRTGVAEVLFAAGKTSEQLSTLIARSLKVQGQVLATRVSTEQAQHARADHASLIYDPIARLLFSEPPPPTRATVGVLSAGTSDQPVAEEAAAVLAFLGHGVERLYDVGVAGIHRLFDVLDRARSTRALIVVAGMEGALPSVVAGLVAQPVIAVPTSIGYGASFGGLSALLAMLNACAPGIGVVNIDNGF